MKLAARRNYSLAVAGVTVVFLLNALGLWLGRYYDRDFRNDPIYPTYLRLRDLAMRPYTIISVASVLTIWSGLIYWRSRTQPLKDNQKIAYFCVLLAVVYGFILTVYFKL